MRSSNPTISWMSCTISYQIPSITFSLVIMLAQIIITQSTTIKISRKSVAKIKISLFRLPLSQTISLLILLIVWSSLTTISTGLRMTT